ncbi:MAG: hypothetical protein H0W24_04105 [Lysobacter sp.]|jgi:uncharacterized membrane protein YphA (DoxX/SURF4 family)|nr:hypothetical protein [Lysobacter sp.]MDQ3269114.1 hypothetical protein [Pseudomonadota bacterium]
MDAASYLAETCRLFLLVAFAFAAWTKTVDTAGFSASLEESFRVPARLVGPLTAFVIAAEWIAVALMLSGAWARAGVAMALLLLLAFTTAVAAIVIEKRQAYCSCFGRTPHPVSAVDLVRNSLYILACGYYLLHAASPASIELVAQSALLMVAVWCFLVSIRLNEIRLLLR